MSFKNKNKKQNEQTKNFKSNCSSKNTWLCSLLLNSDWLTSGYTLQENWHSIFQKLTIANGYIARHGLCAHPLSMMGFCLAWACTGFLHAVCNLYDIFCVTVLLCPECVSMAFGSYTLFILFSKWHLSFGKACSLDNWASVTSSSLLLGQLWTFVLISYTENNASHMRVEKCINIWELEQVISSQLLYN